MSVNQRAKDGSYEKPSQFFYERFMEAWVGKKSLDALGGHRPGGVAGYIEALSGFTFKPETLTVGRSFSSNEFLGHQLYVTEEFADTSGAGSAIIAARPLEKIMFSVIWPKSRLTKFQTNAGLTPTVYRMIRAVSGYLEGALAWPCLRTPLQALYEEMRGSTKVPVWEGPTAQELMDEELSDATQYELGRAPHEVLDSILEADWQPESAEEAPPSFTLGQFPTVEFIWRLHTGLPLPRRIEVDDSSSFEDEVDLSDLGGLHGAITEVNGGVIKLVPGSEDLEPDEELWDDEVGLEEPDPAAHAPAPTAPPAPTAAT